MKVDFVVKPVEESAMWDKFVQTAHGGTVFATSAWMKAMARAFEGKSLFYGCYKNSNLIAGTPVLIRGDGRFVRAATPPLTPYGGFLFSKTDAKRLAKTEAEQHRASSALIELFGKEASYCAFTHHPDIRDMRQFQWKKGWKVKVNYTYHIDIADPSKLWDRFENRTKTAIRKSEKEGFKVVKKVDIEDFIRFYAMVYRKQRIAPPLQIDIVRKCAEHVQEAGLSEMYAAVAPSGEVASVVIFVLGDEALYAWISGANPAFSRSGATALLYWKVMEELSSRCKTFDFVGANMPSIAFFKRGFCGELVPYYSVEHYAPGAGRIIKVAKQLRKFLIK